MDIYSKTLVAIHVQLNRWRHQKEAPDCYPCYVAEVIRNNWIGWLRKTKREYPETKVHSILTRNRSLASWRDASGQKMVGYTAWADNQTAPARDARITALRKDPDAFVRAGLARRHRSRDLERCGASDLLVALLDEAGGPIEFEEAVAALGTFRQFSTGQIVEFSGEGQSESAGEDAGKSIDRHADRRIDTENHLIHQEFLRQWWLQIKNLPLNQRKALLLTLQMGVIFGLINMEVATFREMADVLDMTLEELNSVFKRLPVDDSVLAKELSTSEKNIQNLRNTAQRAIRRRISPYTVGELRALWEAAIALQRPRSTVFMLNHRIDPDISILHQVAEQSVATKEAIAKALQLEQKLLEALWPNLPLRFDAVGRALNKTHQEIAQLYMEAYEELGHRLKLCLTDL